LIPRSQSPLGPQAGAKPSEKMRSASLPNYIHQLWDQGDSRTRHTPSTPPPRLEIALPWAPTTSNPVSCSGASLPSEPVRSPTKVPAPAAVLPTKSKVGSNGSFCLIVSDSLSLIGGVMKPSRGLYSLRPTELDSSSWVCFPVLRTVEARSGSDSSSSAFAWGSAVLPNRTLEKTHDTI
jgi:hypothetical protein